MIRKLTALRGVLAAAAVILTVLLTSGRVFASDKIHLKDGRVLEGTVAREVNGYVWFTFKVGELETEQMFKPEEITKIERDTKPAEPAAATKPDAKDTGAAPKSGVPRIAVITLGEGGEKDMVGIFMTADALKRALPLLEEEQVTDVIFRVNSGGGALLEIQKLSDVIHNEYKKKFRVVAWIESAISAAAMTSHCIEEIYMMPQGNYGACTGWFGALVAVKGRELEEVLYMMEKISARGKHDPQIMRAMQIMEPLSCTIDEQTGEVKWYQNLDGQYVVNPKDRILTFNAETAVKYKFAKGVAATADEVAKLMGYNEYVLVGKAMPGVAYPICRAEELQREFRDRTFKDQQATQTYFAEYQLAIGAAQSAQPADRGKFVAKARAALDKIRGMVKNNPAFRLFVFNMSEQQFKDWLEQQEQLLRDLTKR